MIFKSLNVIENLSVNERLKHLGTKKKKSCAIKTFRSNMMLNPLKLKHLNNIDNLPADMITLNLEDAIAPSRKKEALHNIALFLSHLEKSNSFIIVRTNPIEEGGREEIAFLNSFSFDAVRVAKVRTREEIEEIDILLNSEKEIHVSMETKEAFQNLATFGGIERFTTVNIGILDLLTSLGLPQSLVERDNPTIHYILSKFLVDAKSIGVNPISFMFQEYKDTKGFRAWCELEKKMGFTTKACMGPIQVAIANEVFGINEEGIQRALHIKKAFEASSKKGENGFMDEKYGFIDEPIYRDALLVLSDLRN
ncbi:MAG: Malyl-CoA lyase (EC [uncultured Sulfurovum sp.]|uniref:Malyl-CoA lyase (EC) n=1 Tax=uncultured Sulfurovum sp. TaxID=269237 RepID=A0A6S6TCG9_9BACT|nr:MAG: Malyl-CoA lyase (EC [uncultured Sulfurovum sp.]